MIHKLSEKLKNYWREYRFPIIAVGIWFICLNIIAIWTNTKFADGPNNIPGVHNHWLNLWAKWDSFYYFEIAQHGYGSWGGALPVFFPFYPLLMRLLGGVIGHLLPAGLLISWISIFAAIITFFKLVKFDNNKEIAKKSLIFLLIFPTSFFFLAMYTESLFFFLVILCIYLTRKGKFWLAASIGLFASATRLVGVLLVLPMVVEIYQQTRNLNFNNRILKMLSIALVPMGLVAYSLYLQFHFGDFLYFQHAYKFGWTYNHFNPNFFALFYGYISAIMDYFHRMFIDEAFWNMILVDFVPILMVLILLILGRNKIRKSYYVYTFFSLLVVLSSNSMASSIRYVLVFFPIYIILAKLLSDRPLLEKIVSYIFVALLAIGTALFANALWTG